MWPWQCGWLLGESALNCLLQLRLCQTRTHKKLLPRASTEGDCLPAILSRYGDAHFHRAAGVAHLLDDAGDDAPDLVVVGEQTLAEAFHAVDDAVLDLELVLSGAEAHAGLIPA